MTDRRLIRELGLVLVLKLLLLTALWWAFVHDARVQVDAASMGGTLSGGAAAVQMATSDVAKLGGHDGN